MKPEGVEMLRALRKQMQAVYSRACDEAAGLEDPILTHGLSDVRTFEPTGWGRELGDMIARIERVIIEGGER